GQSGGGGGRRRRRGGRGSLQVEIEADVAAGRAGLVNLHGQDVVARLKQGGADRSGIERRVLDGGRRGRGVADRAAGHVGAIDLVAVQVDHRAVVAEDVEIKRLNRRGVGDIKTLAEVGGDVLVGAVSA